MASTPSAAQTPIATPLSALPSTGRTTSKRKTLIDADRRRICQYAKEHPAVRQTEIGVKFGVERSTVSKILRDKKKYLSQDDGSNATSRKAKNKPPDIERALSNWAKNQYEQGLPVSDSLIKEKLCVFATTMGNTYDLPGLTSDSWLDEFKVKNGLTGTRSREKIIAEDIGKSSHPGAPEPSEPVNAEHKRVHSLSTGSLMSASAGATTASSPRFTSPQSPDHCLDDANAFVPLDRSRSSSSSRNPHLPCGQTFVMLGVEPCLSPPSMMPFAREYITATAAASSMPEISVLNPSGPSSTTPMQPPPRLPSRNVEMPSPVSPSLQLSSGMISSPTLPGISEYPTAEEAQRALEVLIKFFEQNPAQIMTPEVYCVMGRLMDVVQV